MSSSITPNSHSETTSAIRNYWAGWATAWNAFWFRPQVPTVLGLIRVFVGCIVLYTHWVWTLELSTFLGRDGLIPAQYRELVFDSRFAWSHLDWFQSPSALLSVHVVGLVLIGLFTVGYWTRWTSIATALLVISYANRATGALFGLDQINAFICLYLAVGNSGGAFSVDRWLKQRRENGRRENGETTTSRAGQGSLTADTRTNIAIRLIQVHMCIVYLFAGIGKLQGETWLNGEAIWGAFASYEYQTVDMTWMVNHMGMVTLLTIGTWAWELSYIALIWPRLTRPIMLAIAIPVHLGIGFCMGMLPFGLIMLAGNFAFVEPSWIPRFLHRYR